VQFQKWGFPQKYRRPWRDDQLVARVRELWNQSFRHREILAQLHEEGYDIETHELARLRTRFGMKLRENGGAFGANDARDGGKNGSGSGSGSGSEEDEGDGGESEDEGGGDDGHGQGGYEAGGAGGMLQTSGVQTGNALPPPDPEAEARKAERKRALEIVNAELLATKKRRRHTKPYAGLPADPPAPPRFPSETTLEESKAILQIGGKDYTEMRATFQRICEETGVMKKTIAGPERWEAMKEQLIRESMHLRAVMWDPTDMEKKRLAVEIIANDVTKRIRVVGNIMSIAEAKRVVGLNPAQGNEVRAELYKLLEEDQFGSRREEGRERWEELKRVWIERSPLLSRVTAPTDSEEHNERMRKAVQRLARDTVRRHREDQNRKARAAAAPPSVPKPKYKNTRPKPDLSLIARTAAVNASSASFNSEAPPPAPPPPPRRTRRVQPQIPPPPDPHTEARLLPPDDEMESFDTAEHDIPEFDTPGLGTPDPGTPELDTNLLLPSSESHNPFMSREYIQAYHAAASGRTLAPPAAVYQPPPRPRPAPAPRPVQSAATGVYFRLHPSSSVLASPMWISTISSRSITALRAAAVAKYSGQAICVGIEGIIKDGKGGEMLPLPVNDDDELDAYLQHVQGMMAPTFNVTLVAPVVEEGEWV